LYSSRELLSHDRAGPLARGCYRGKDFDQYPQWLAAPRQILFCWRGQLQRGIDINNRHESLRKDLPVKRQQMMWYVAALIAAVLVALGFGAPPRRFCWRWSSSPAR
jgi:hypothetical protein